jgi:drug/metabolite transporter (DMT)-like permease
VDKKSKGYFALLVTSFFWGTTWIVSKIGISEIPPLQMSAIRQLIAASIILIFFLGVKKIPLPNLKQLIWLIIMGFLMFVFANGFSTWSLQYIPAGLSTLIGALYPLTVVIIERLFFKAKKMTALTLVGFLLGIIGIAVVFSEHLFHKENINFYFGSLLSFIAMLSWSFATIFTKKNAMNLDPYYSLGWQMLVGSLVLFILAKANGPLLPLQLISLKVWMAIAYLVVLGSIVSFTAFIYSMKKLPVAIASLYAYINPLVAMILAYYIIDEKLTFNILWGAIITLLGVFLVNYSIKKNSKDTLPKAE